MIPPPDQDGIIPAAAFTQLGLAFEALAPLLLERAKARAIAPISQFRVGAVALGGTGALYLGANVEILGEALGHSVHAEQAAVALARAAGERSITALAISAPPCGFCRQFLMEIEGAGDLAVLLPGRAGLRLGDLLPEGFGPGDLGRAGGLLSAPDHPLRLVKGRHPPLAEAALQAARTSLAPYSGCPSGVALAMADGRIFAGAYLENAAFNPSLSPLGAALAALAMAGGNPRTIVAAMLVETAGPVSQRRGTDAVLGALAGLRTLVRRAERMVPLSPPRALA